MCWCGIHKYVKLYNWLITTNVRIVFSAASTFNPVTLCWFSSQADTDGFYVSVSQYNYGLIYHIYIWVRSHIFLFILILNSDCLWQ